MARGRAGRGATLKAAFRPAPRDAVWAVAALVLFGVAWGTVWFYVVSTWESGEVVQLTLADNHVARVWVLDTEAGPAMYYDAPPRVAELLLASAPVTMTRNDGDVQGCARASRVEALPEARVQQLLGRMQTKYAHRNTATAVYYALLGVRRNRLGLVIEIGPCD